MENIYLFTFEVSFKTVHFLACVVSSLWLSELINVIFLPILAFIYLCIGLFPGVCFLIGKHDNRAQLLMELKFFLTKLFYSKTILAFFTRTPAHVLV